MISLIFCFILLANVFMLLQVALVEFVADALDDGHGKVRTMFGFYNQMVWCFLLSVLELTFPRSIPNSPSD